jgi:hypothetical protein
MSGIEDLFEDQQIRPVSINGTTKHVRELSGTEIYEVYEKAEKSGAGLVRELLTKAICDEGGRPLATKKDVDKLSKKWIDAFFEAAGDLNGIGASEKNSGAGQS